MSNIQLPQDPLPVVLFGSTHEQRRSALESITAVGHLPILPSCDGDLAPFNETFSGRLFDALAVPPRPEGPILRRAAENLTSRFGDRWISFGADDHVCMFSAALSSYGGIATFPVRAAHSTLHKDRLRTLWNEMAAEDEEVLKPVAHTLLSYAGFAVTDAELQRGIERFPSWDKEAIIKPNGLNSAIEVHRVRSAREGLETVRSILATLREHQEYALVEQGVVLTPDILVEEAILRRVEPSEYSVEVFSVHGDHKVLGITEKRADPQTNFETGMTYPATSFPESLAPHVSTVLNRLLRRLGVQNCFSHWEFIVTPDERIGLVEGQLRPGGGISRLHQLAYGRDPYGDFFAAVQRDACVASFAPPPRVAAIRALAPEHPLHRIEKILHTEANREGEYLLLMEEELLETEHWVGPTNWLNNFAGVLVSGTTQATAESRCAEIASSVLLQGQDRSGKRRESRLVVARG